MYEMEGPRPATRHASLPIARRPALRGPPPDTSYPPEVPVSPLFRVPGLPPGW